MRATPVPKNGPGRPRKFGRAARPVTITLPEDVLARLSSVDPDLGRAIVRLVEHRTGPALPAPRPAELATYGRHAVIVVTPVKALTRIAGVQLVPIGSGRALISLERSRSIPELELALRDAAALPAIGAHERQVLEAVADILRDARASRITTAEERKIIVLESRRSQRPPVR